MKQSLINYITKIATPTKVVVTALVAVISAVSTLAMVIYNKGKADAKKEVKEISYEGKIDKLIKADSLKTITLQKLIVNQDSIIDDQRDHMMYESKQEARFKTLESSYTDFLQVANRLDVYVKYLEATKKENEKKNSMKGSGQ
jgi:hypothetical protein